MHVKLLEECLAVRGTLVATLWAGRAWDAGEAERMSQDTFLEELAAGRRQPRGGQNWPGQKVCVHSGPVRGRGAPLV